MSVIINGMAMPETCYECRFCEEYSEYPFTPFCVAHLNAIEDPRSGRLDTCPLNELPNHNGLIDAKSISEKIGNIWDGRPLSMLGGKILAMIDKEPRVIEAERSEE